MYDGCYDDDDAADDDCVDADVACDSDDVDDDADAGGDDAGAECVCYDAYVNDGADTYNDVDIDCDANAEYGTSTPRSCGDNGDYYDVCDDDFDDGDDADAEESSGDAKDDADNDGEHVFNDYADLIMVFLSHFCLKPPCAPLQVSHSSGAEL